MLSYSRKYACSWSLFKLLGKIVGIPGINIFSCSLPPHLERFLLSLSSLSTKYKKREFKL